ncbi:protein kinase [Pelatocladus sp. BLCC-F211]|uniref:protein kinase domain-containing protein n=1 Tax=Pelatocladus sp. BLCC-F211 TaxID=3342752 RepID=UPI0035B7D65C
MSVAPFIRDLSKYKFGIPLKPIFRFAHEPVHSGSSLAFIGRQAELDTLAERILFSNGGSFLVTGYRGVGKTSFVNQVIKHLEESLPWAETYLGKVEILAVQLNMARPLQPAELMHHIIRRLYHKLLEKGIFSYLSLDLQEQIALAYHRTSVNMTRTMADSSESNFGINEFSLTSGKLKASFKPAISYKRSHTQNYQAAFLGYDDKAAEYDVIEISRRLTAGYIKQSKLWQQNQPSLLSKSNKRIRLKIIFVFDEMDKLEEYVVEDAGTQKLFIDVILSNLKNLFTTSGISFIFVAGKDLQERWLEDLGKGDSIYESVFSYDKYLPCMWADVNHICDALIDWGAVPDHPTLVKDSCSKCGTPTVAKQMFCNNCGAYVLDPSEAKIMFEDFKKYLAYRGRGLPRRIIRGFNEYVQWNQKRPILVFTHQDVRRIRFYAGLQDVLVENLRKLLGNITEESLGSQKDKQLLGIYYLVDWILRQGNREFSLNDAIKASKQLSAKIALAEEIALHIIGDVINFLLKNEYLEDVKTELSQAQIVDVNVQIDKLYKIPPRRITEMTGISDIFEEEAYILRQEENVSVQIENYKIIEKVGLGGMASVYRAWDELNERCVAIKLLNNSLASNSQAVKRFKREAEVMRTLKHPNIVNFYDIGEVKGQHYIVMDYIDGPNLSTVIDKQGKLEFILSLNIIKPVVEALFFIHNQGFFRNDVKPGNILFSTTGKVFITDFGISKSNQPDMEITGMIMPIGTPHYMSPEQWENQLADARTDIYAIGVTLYEMITGRRPFEGDSVEQIRQRHLYNHPIPPSRWTNLTPEAEAIILKCLEKNPEQRFQNMSELASELTKIIDKYPSVDLIPILEMTVGQVKNDIVFELQDTEFPASIDFSSDNYPLPEPPVPTSPFSSTQIQVFGSHLFVLASSESTSSISVGSVIQLNKDTTSFGRSNDNEIYLENNRVSRFHARIINKDGIYYIEDLNSSFGTLVNDSLIRGLYPLKMQDKIQIADFIFEFRQS